MGKARIWFPDPLEYVSKEKIQVPGSPTQKNYFRISDSYSQWISAYGSEFAFTEEIPKADPNDFKYALVVREVADHVIVEAVKFDFLGNPFAGPGISPPIEDSFLGRLPIRTQSAGPKLGTTAVDGYGILSNAPPGSDPNKLVIVGLIDDAINIGHRRFRDVLGNSRVDRFWMQDGKHQSNSVPFGREYSTGDITEKINENPNDDDAIMRELGLIATPDRPYLPTALRMHASHGTHVADLAAGYDPEEENAVNRRIIAVQLPVFASQDTSGASLMASIISASDYIFKRAEKMSRDLGVSIPVVLNFSYGFGGGPRNGQHIVERALRKQAEQYRQKTEAMSSGVPAPAELVLPAGNGHLSRTHACGAGPLANTAPVLDFNLRVQPEDRSSSFVEIWFSEKTHHISVRVETPDGLEETFPFDLASGYDNQVSLDSDMVLAEPEASDLHSFKEGTIVARISVDRPNLPPPVANHTEPVPTTEDCTPFWRVVLALGPSTCLRANQTPCPHGIWKVACQGHANGRGAIQAWIQRDEAVGGFGESGRQAYFDDTVYEDNRFDEIGDVVVTDQDQPESIVKRDGTVSGIATNPVGESKPLLVIGGALWDSDRAAVYSAADNDTKRSAPHFLAPSESSRILTGINATATRNGGQVTMGGTSVAAPQVVRLLADKLESIAPNKYATFDARRFLKREASKVLRPDLQNPERAGNRRVREERVRYEKGLIKPHPQLTQNIKRQTSRKV